VSLPSAVSATWGKIQSVKFPGSKVTWFKLKCISTRKTCNVNLQWVNVNAYNFFVSGSSPIFLFNTGRIAVDNTIFCLLISLWVPEIFVVKVKSCPVSCQILDIFAIPNFKGQHPKKLYPLYHPI